MIIVGKRQSLKLVAENKSGYILQDEEGHEVFMPGSLGIKGLELDANVDVFVFVDSKKDVIATLNMPYAKIGELAVLKVKSVTAQGAFLDLGLPKDLFVPKNLQNYQMKENEMHLVRVMQDDRTLQLYGDAKIRARFDQEEVDLKKSQEIEIVPYYRTDLGFKILIEQRFLGMIYHGEIFSEIQIGTKYQATVKSIRDDGMVDAVMGKRGLEGIEDHSLMILKALRKANGRLELSDQSKPEEIRRHLGMSKKAFKKAIGNLYKSRKIRLGEDYFELISSPEDLAD